MCIIIYKPIGEDLPEYRSLKQCWMNNPDGAGIMWADGTAVRLVKGFMTWVEFEEALCEMVRYLDVRSVPIAIHFRLASHGAVTPGNCHPFAVEGNIEAMRQTRVSADVGFMHNGVLNGLETNEDTSDTMAFAQSVLVPLKSLCDDFLNDPRVVSIISATTQGSRFLLMSKDGEIRTFGKWFTEDGIMYSKDNYGADESQPEDKIGEAIYNTWHLFGENSHIDAASSMFPDCTKCGRYLECVQSGSQCKTENEAAEQVLKQ